jgi:pyruvate dehydrogenase E1 component beta subunit
LDHHTIIESVKKTGRLVTVEEGYPQCGIGAEICALIMECRKINEKKLTFLASAFDYLDAPVERVTGMDVPLPYSFGMEQAALPQVDNIANVVRKVLRGAKL